MDNFNNTFHKKLYVDSLKRLRMQGMVLLFLCLLATFLPICLGSGSTHLHSIGELTPILTVYMYFGPLALAFSGFAFLFRRNASDFYHGLPFTRRGLYSSVLLAVLTWVLGTVAATCLFGYACLAIFGWPMEIGFLPYLLMGYGFGAMLVTACAVIGICATGTRFSAFIVAGLVLFLPRFLSAVCGVIMVAVSPILLPVHEGMLFNYTLNFPVSVFVQGFGGMSVLGVYRESPFLQSGTYIYTFLLALLYTVFGGYIFHKRASEIAEHAAPSKLLQHVYRCLITFPVLFGIATSLVMSKGSLGVNGTIVMFVVALVIYCLYELITTKRFQNLLPALCVLPIAIAASFVLVWGTSLYAKGRHNILPGPGEITGIQSNYFDADHYYNTGFYYAMPFRNHSYEALRADEAYITTPEILEIVQESFAYTLQNVNSGNNAPFRSREVDESIILRISRRGGGVLYRRLYVSGARVGRFAELVAAEPLIDAALLALPEQGEIRSISARGYGESFGSEAAVRLFQVFRQEYEGMALEEQRAYKRYKNGGIKPVARLETRFPEPVPTPIPGLGGLYWQAGEVWLSSDIWVTGIRSRKNFEDSYPIGAMMPATANATMEEANKSARPILDVMQVNGARDNLDHVNIDLQLYNVEISGVPMQSNSISWGCYKGEVDFAKNAHGQEIYMTMESSIKLLGLATAQEGAVNINGPFARISFSGRLAEYDERDGGYVGSGEIYVPLSGRLLEDILSMLEEPDATDKSGLRA